MQQTIRMNNIYGGKIEKKSWPGWMQNKAPCEETTPMVVYNVITTVI